MSVDKDLALKLCETLQLLSGGKEGERPGVDGKGKAAKSAAAKAAASKLDINTVMATLLNLLVEHTAKNYENLANQTQRIDTIEKEHAKRYNLLQQKSRIQDDLIDEVRQRGLKGNLIITSPNLKKAKSLISPPDQLETNNLSITDHAVKLIKQKYGVHIPTEDIQACHYLPTKSNGKTLYTAILIRIWNRRARSAWSLLKTKILSGEGNNSLNVFVNFQLTKRRNTLAFHLRNMKKDKKIVKYYTDENGHLSFKKSESSPKTKITFVQSGKDVGPTTMLPDELSVCVK